MTEIQKLINNLRGQFGAMIAQQPRARYGIVESFDPNTYTARVTIQPDQILSGWLPVLTQWVGNGWGLFCPPTPGDQVKLVPQENDSDSYAIIGGAYSTADVPLPAPSGEFWLVHQTGSFIKLLNDGTIASKGTWNHEGNLTATGEITRGFGTSDPVTLGQHTHDQPNDTAGDGEAATYAPNPGT